MEFSSHFTISPTEVIISTQLLTQIMGILIGGFFALKFAEKIAKLLKKASGQ